jgi:hypothetical protein
MEVSEAKLVRRVHELTQRYPRLGDHKIFARIRGEGFALGLEPLSLIRQREGLAAQEAAQTTPQRKEHR